MTTVLILFVAIVLGVLVWALVRPMPEGPPGPPGPPGPKGDPAPVPVVKTTTTQPGYTTLRLVNAKGAPLDTIHVERRRPTVTHRGRVYMAAHRNADGTWVYKHIETEKQA